MEWPPKYGSHYTSITAQKQGHAVAGISPPLENATETLESLALFALRADHESRRLASRRTAAGMTRRRFDVKVEIQRLCNFLLHSCRIDLRQRPPRHSNLRFSARPVSRMPLRGTRIRLFEAARIFTP